VKVFISYRRSDAPSAARQLASALKARLGEHNVYFDRSDVATGVEWRADVVGRVRDAEVVLVVMGPHWAQAASGRAREGLREPALEDIVRVEVETAFADRTIVIPVLVDDATMPPRRSLPRAFRPLADVQARSLRGTDWDRDVEALAEDLAGLRRSAVGRRGPPASPPARRFQPSTDAERVASYLLDGTVVTVLGSGVNAADADEPWTPEDGRLPDAGELARHLARRFGLGLESDDLARVSEHVLLTEGRVDLLRALRDLMCRADRPPGAVHRLLAEVPWRLREAGRDGGQLLITANWDTALERAFDAVREPYDLVLFMAEGEHRGRFVHVPWEAGPRAILTPNEYVDLPIDEYGALERTVVVKLHGGAVDLGPGWPAARDNFVVTEDDYIGYLTQSPVECLIPFQVLNKIRDSHFLFLRYRLRDWSVRVFLQRVWGDRRLDARSWAVGPGDDAIERGLWEQRGVRHVEAGAAAFLEDVEGALHAGVTPAASW
jgi:hypothetical protein